MAGVDDILRVVLAGVQVDDTVWNHVYHFVGLSGAETDYDALLADIELAFDTAYANLEAVTVDFVTTSDIILSEWDFSSHEWDGKSQSSAGCLVGALAAGALPAGNAIVVRFFTKELRRQARKFIPGLNETHNDGNDVGASAVTAALNYAGDIVGDIVAGGLTIRPCTFNDTPTSVRYETHSQFNGDYFVNSKSGYQRRRQVGAGI